MIRTLFLCLLCIFHTPLIAAKQKPYVTAKINGQMGNNMFQIATAQALAWKYNARACFRQLNPDSPITQHVFSRVNHGPYPKDIAYRWEEPTHAYRQIPYYPNMEIVGHFQCEKYFLRYRKGLLKLFAPHPDDQNYIKNKYDWLIDHPNTIGVQIRDYRVEDPLFPTYGKEFLESAMALFPSESLFIVSSNNLEYAKTCIPDWAENVIFLENEPSYIDFYLLSMCKHNIITNSTFGWWAAWLNQNRKKTVVCPSYWYPVVNCKDICPKRWIKIDSAYE